MWYTTKNIFTCVYKNSAKDQTEQNRNFFEQTNKILRLKHIRNILRLQIKPLLFLTPQPVLRKKTNNFDQVAIETKHTLKKRWIQVRVPPYFKWTVVPDCDQHPDFVHCTQHTELRQSRVTSFEFVNNLTLFIHSEFYLQNQ